MFEGRSLSVSATVQRGLIFWSLVLLGIFMLAFVFLIRLVPLPPATLTAGEVAGFYKANSGNIRIGAVLASWVAGFMIPLALVISMQMMRLERGFPIWSMLQFAGGCMMSIFLVLPPLIWGVAAFSPERPAEITAAIHELGNLTLVTTDQYFIFQFVAIAVVSLTAQHDKLSPFPRWFGYYTVWTAFMFEVGALGFIPKTGPFAWNGLFVFWIPLLIFVVWIIFTSVMILRVLERQGASVSDHGGGL